MKIFTVLIGFLLCNSAATAGKFYKWVDANGNIHYSDNKPENKKTTEIKVNTSQPQIIENNETDDKQSNKKSKAEKAKK